MHLKTLAAVSVAAATAGSSRHSSSNSDVSKAALFSGARTLRTIIKKIQLSNSTIMMIRYDCLINM